MYAQGVGSTAVRWKVGIQIIAEIWEADQKEAKRHSEGAKRLKNLFF
jgi:hypothetical protein